MIFAAIALAWLVYLVPHFVRRKDSDPVDDVDPADRFSDSVRIVQQGTAPLLDQDLEEIGFEVSTPLTRRAAINDLVRLERLAASRRRRVLLALAAVLSAVIVVAALNLLPWWTVAVPGGLVLGFLVLARFSVRAMRRDLDRRFERISRGGVEATVFLRKADLKAAVNAPKEPTTEISVAPADGGRLWDPIPVTTATYVSKPLAPRTVRTIDLSGPTTTVSARPVLPVTADAPVVEPATRRDDEGTGSQAASA